MAEPRVIELTEYASCHLPLEALTYNEAILIGTHRDASIRVERTWHQDEGWKLTSQGYVGYLPVTPDLHLAMQPKVPLGNLFAMLEVAYEVGQFLREDSVQVETLEELYERLAHVLARRVLDRVRRGLYRTYLGQHDATPYIRGRIDIARASRAPWDPRLPCAYRDHTADVMENQILAWTLYSIARAPFCGERARPVVRQAFRQLANRVSVEYQDPTCCRSVPYHRLNEDYRPLHILCRFFLEHSGPAHHRGDRAMIPFLIPMASLFETYVARWLTMHSPPGCRVQAQRRLIWEPTLQSESWIDLVLNDEQGNPLCVADTKYKDGAHVSEEDIHQIYFYAGAMGVREAVLIYPTPLIQPVDTRIGDVHVRTLSLDLAGDLEQAGQGLAQGLAHITGLAQDISRY
jgi:5-methylcytosine-specific restriction enzyme subunit McrC